MRCAVLGPLEIRGDRERLLEFAGGRERLLLALLAAASPQVVTDERLVEQLWHGRPPPSARKSLQAAVVRLRTALEPGRPRGSPGRFVVRRQHGYALSLEREGLDAAIFADRVAAGRASLVSGDPQGARALLEQALQLWRGEPYAEWSEVPELERERVRLRGIHDLACESLLAARLALGEHDEVVPDLRRLCLEQPLHERWWELLALALYRGGSQGEALETVRRARAVLGEELGIDPGVGLRDLEQKVLAQDPSLNLGGAPVVTNGSPAGEPFAVSGCPWKGLARYETDDAAVFHGRARLVTTIVGALVDHVVVVLSGSSGAGKSSVARAGVLTALATGTIPGSQAWQPWVLTADGRPVDALAPLSGDTPPPAPVVLVCDQLEQLWSPEVEGAERTAFLDEVMALVADGVVVRVLLVVRGDHVGRLAEHPGLADRMLGGLVMVPPMTELELREVVEAPAVAAGLSVEPELTEAAVRDVLGRAGALPLLSTALVQTWERRRNATITLAGYLASGGVAGAVGRAAEQVHGSWTARERDVARRVLVRLAEQDDDGTVRARRLPRAELEAVGTEPDAVRRVVADLLGARLLAEEDDDDLAVAHEALLSSWPRLSEWLEEDSVGRAVRRHLAPAAVEWDARGRPADELFRGARLEAAAQWLATPDNGATPVEREFVDAGVARAELELRAAREHAEAEATAHRRTRRLARLLAVALVLALGAGVVALDSQRRADDEAAAAKSAGVVADANRLAALSSSERSLDLALLLAAAAVQTADTPATRDSLLDALVEHRRATAVRRLDVDGLQQTALSANGRTLAVTRGAGLPRLFVWHPGSRRDPEVLGNWWPEGLAVSDDGTVVVASGLNQGFGVWAYDDSGQKLWSIPADKLGGYPYAVGFTAPDRLMVVAQHDRPSHQGYSSVLTEVAPKSGATARVGALGHTAANDVRFAASFSDDALVVQTTDGRAAWVRDLSTGRVRRLRLATRGAASLEFVALPGGESAQLWSDGAVTRYDSRGRAAQELDVHRAAVRDVRVLPGGRTAVTTGNDAQVVLWDIDGRGRWSFAESLAGHTGPVVQAEVSADATSLLTAATDGEVVTWDLTADAGLGSTYPGLTGLGRYVSNRLQVVEPGRLVVAPTRTLSSQPRGFTESPGADTLSVAAVFLDPRSGQVLDEVGVGDTSDTLFGSSVGVSPDRRWVSVTTNYRTTILDARSREVVGRLRVPRSMPSDTSWLPDGSRMLVALQTDVRDQQPLGQIAVVEPGSWEVERMVRLEPPPPARRRDGEMTGTPQVFEWSPDERTLAVGVNFTNSLVLFDGQLREQHRVHLGEGGDVFDLSFSTDGRYLAAGRAGGKLTVLDTRDWEPVHESVTMHAELITDVEWLPDNNTVVTTGRDEMVSLYDVERDLVRGSGLPAAEQPGDGYTFLLPDPEDEVVVFNEGGPGHVYPMDPARWLGLACTVAGRDLTRAEWDRYLPGRPYRAVCDLKRS